MKYTKLAGIYSGRLASISAAKRIRASKSASRRALAPVMGLAGHRSKTEDGGWCGLVWRHAIDGQQLRHRQAARSPCGAATLARQDAVRDMPRRLGRGHLRQDGADGINDRQQACASNQQLSTSPQVDVTQALDGALASRQVAASCAAGACAVVAGGTDTVYRTVWCHRNGVSSDSRNNAGVAFVWNFARYEASPSVSQPYEWVMWTTGCNTATWWKP